MAMTDRNLDSVALGCLIPQLFPPAVVSFPAPFIIALNWAVGHYYTTALSLSSQESVGFPSCLKTTATSAHQAAVHPLPVLLWLQLCHALLYHKIGSLCMAWGTRLALCVLLLEISWKRTPWFLRTLRNITCGKTAGGLNCKAGQVGTPPKHQQVFTWGCSCQRAFCFKSKEPK